MTTSTPLLRPRLLFVCMGNICRSPTVEVVARAEFARAGLDIVVDSAGTEDYHIGKQADARSIRMAERHGYPLAAHRARQVSAEDFEHWDHLLVMDQVNLRALLARTPAVARERVQLFLPFAGISNVQELPDPYYGQEEDFTLALTLAQRGVAGLIERWSKT